MQEQIYTYKGYHGCDSKCGLAINGNIVMVTEIEDNEGTSITNMAERLATQIIREFNIRPEKLIWIEHYPERGSKYDPFLESFDLVSFEWTGKEYCRPSWKGITKEVALGLLT